MRQIDLIIIGGGCAGLSLASQLVDQIYQGQGVVLESRAAYEDDRSWCFWDTQPSAYQDLISQSWHNWRFSIAKETLQTRSCKGYAYHYIRAADFYSQATAKLAKSKGIELKLNTPVISVSQEKKGWRVTTSHQEYFASQVIDTRPPTSEDFNQASLFQCFMGLEVAKCDSWQKTDSLDLMTEMRVAEGAFCFNYILPLSSKKTLVEITFFSSKPIDQKTISNYLSDLIWLKGWQHAQVIREEIGILPMGLPTLSKTNAVGYIKAGIGGGLLRASSGYGFLRIQRWAKQAADAIILNNIATAQPQSDPVLAFMDRIFLRVIQQRPDLGPIIFERLLAKVPPIRFLRFMDDYAYITDLFSIIMHLPKAPFLKALISLFRRK